jgi:hypothetical protein
MDGSDTGKCNAVTAQLSTLSADYTPVETSDSRELLSCMPAWYAA